MRFVLVPVPVLFASAVLALPSHLITHGSIRYISGLPLKYLSSVLLPRIVLSGCYVPTILYWPSAKLIARALSREALKYLDLVPGIAATLTWKFKGLPSNPALSRLLSRTNSPLSALSNDSPVRYLAGTGAGAKPTTTSSRRRVLSLKRDRARRITTWKRQIAKCW